MKSKKVDKYLNRVYMGDPKVKAYNRFMVHKAIEVAEQELLEWHDPKDTPEHTNAVLFKHKNDSGDIRYTLCSYLHGQWWGRPCLPGYEFVGWREIHE